MTVIEKLITTMVYAEIAVTIVIGIVLTVTIKTVKTKKRAASELDLQNAAHNDGFVSPDSDMIALPEETVKSGSATIAVERIHRVFKITDIYPDMEMEMLYGESFRNNRLNRPDEEIYIPDMTERYTE